MVGRFRKKSACKEVQNDLELTKRALRIAKFDKLIVAVFNVIVSVIPFTSLFFGISSLGLDKLNFIEFSCHLWVHCVVCNSDTFILC